MIRQSLSHRLEGFESRTPKDKSGASSMPGNGNESYTGKDADKQQAHGNGGDDVTSPPPPPPRNPGLTVPNPLFSPVQATGVRAPNSSSSSQQQRHISQNHHHHHHHNQQHQHQHQREQDPYADPWHLHHQGNFSFMVGGVPAHPPPPLPLPPPPPPAPRMIHRPLPSAGSHATGGGGGYDYSRVNRMIRTGGNIARPPPSTSTTHDFVAPPPAVRYFNPPAPGGARAPAPAPAPLPPPPRTAVTLKTAPEPPSDSLQPQQEEEVQKLHCGGVGAVMSSQQPVVSTQQARTNTSFSTPKGPKQASRMSSKGASVGRGGSKMLPTSSGKHGRHSNEENGNNYNDPIESDTDYMADYNDRRPGKKKGRKPIIDQKRVKRKNSSSSNTPGGAGGSTGSNRPPSMILQIVNDEYPDRIVNPLLEIPHPNSNNGFPVHGSELLTLTGLSFHKPDTYPISYMARLLGFDIPVPNDYSAAAATAANGSDSAPTTARNGTPPPAPLVQPPVDYPAPFPNIDTLPFVSKDKDVFYQVPDAPKIAPRYPKVSNIGDEADQHTLDYMDPIYAHILQNGFTSKILKSATSARVSKFVATQKQLSQTRQNVMEQSYQILNLSKDWTFEDWTSYTDNTKNSSVGGVGGTGTMTGTTTAAAAATTTTAPPPPRGRPRWTLDGTKVYSNPPPQAFGIIASYKGKPVTILKYQFLWYQIVQQKESEMVMVVEGFGERTNLKETTASSSLTAAAAVITNDNKQPKSDETTIAMTTTTTTVEVAGADDNSKAAAEIACTEDFKTMSHLVTSTISPKEDTNNQVASFEEKETSSSRNEVTTKMDKSIQVVDGSEPPPQNQNESGLAIPVSSEELSKSTTKPKTGADDAVEKETARGLNDKGGASSGKKGAVETDDGKASGSVACVDSATRADLERGGGKSSRANETMDTNTPSDPKATSTIDENEKIEVDEPLPDVQPDDSVVLTMLALALEHTRACGVLYGLWDVPKDHHLELIRKCFRMAELPINKEHHGQPLICDVMKCSSRLAFLMTKQEAKIGPAAEEPVTNCNRLLVRLPTADDAKAMFDAELLEIQQRSTRAVDSTNLVTGVNGAARHRSVVIRVVTGKKEGLKCCRLSEDGSANEELELPEKTNIQFHLDILRCFPVAKPSANPERNQEDEILKELVKKQADLLAAEQSLEPHLRSLMSKVVDERIEYEKPETRQSIEEEKRILKENEKLIERRKEMDQAWQEQLEKDMNAVCSICNDGDVTPDNQILFCEACNVAVHQRCYGVERIPEGDYYCIPCRYFGRDKMQEDLASRLKRNPSATAVPLAPLPISCELCPVKQGAYIRSQTKKSGLEKPSDSKWVHMACAKWYGLNILDLTKPEIVEDVKPLKNYFREKDMQCHICERKRGAYHQCRFEGCEKWIHVSCARAIGTCQVIHGEDVEGKAVDNPWTLMCAEHSDIDPETLEKEPVPKEQLMRAAEEFPDDEMPRTPPQDLKPFHKMSGTERAEALSYPDYERKIMNDLMYKKFPGARCEVCDTIEPEGKNLTRCISCSGVICLSCKLTTDDTQTNDERFFKCHVCRLVKKKKGGGRGGEEETRPQCSLCFQKHGILLPGYGNPINRKTHFKKNQKEFEKSLFSKELWAHYCCAFWLKGLQVNDAEANVDFSHAIMSNGRGFILQKHQCALCGLTGGHKIKCFAPNCRARGERAKPPHFHVTCARQAGFEVGHGEVYEGEFYALCYVHGSNEFNLRAKIEDLMEVEKQRIGKKMTRKETPMNNYDASRLMNHSIFVIRILGWAWRWAEWWVEYDSTWEPLLEPGQKEKDLTKEQLRIVDSTAESRCEDARKCRLAAFGAALRNRNYDIDDGFDNESLDHAIRAVLHTPSLVGPLDMFEIDFLAEWLGRAYRSKSKLMGFGEDKVPVAKHSFCVHIDDQTPKYELGDRPLPGRQVFEDGQIFETGISEPDDYLKPELGADGKPIITSDLNTEKKNVKGKKQSGESRGRKRSRGVENTPEASEPPKRRRSQANDVLQSSSAERMSSVASLTPSAVKNRRTEPNTTDQKKRAFAIKKIRDNDGFLNASVEFADRNHYCLTNPDGPLRKSRRGRPPRIWEIPVVLKVGGEYFCPDPADRILFDEDGTESSGAENHEEGEDGGDVDEGLAGPTSDRVDSTETSADSVLATTSENEATGEKKDLAQTDAATEAKGPVISAECKDEAISIKDGVSVPDTAGRDDDTEKIGTETVDDEAAKLKGIAPDETQIESASISPPKRRRGRPPKSSPTPIKSPRKVAAADGDGASAERDVNQLEASTTSPPKKRRGLSTKSPGSSPREGRASESPPKSTRKRGRPPKSSPPEPEEIQEYVPDRPKRSPKAFLPFTDSQYLETQKAQKPKSSPPEPEEIQEYVPGRPKRSPKAFVPFTVSQYLETQKAHKPKKKEVKGRRGPGRPRKVDTLSTEEESEVENEEQEIVASEPSTRRRVRHPRKQAIEDENDEFEADNDEGEFVPKRRLTGRHRKDDRPVKKSRAERSASKKARAEIQASFIADDGDNENAIGDQAGSSESNVTGKRRRGKREKAVPVDSEKRADVVNADSKSSVKSSSETDTMEIGARSKIERGPFLQRTLSSEKRRSKRSFNNVYEPPSPGKPSPAKKKARGRPKKKKTTEQTQAPNKKEQTPSKAKKEQTPSKAKKKQFPDAKKNKRSPKTRSAKQAALRAAKADPEYANLPIQPPFLHRTLSPEKPGSQRFNLVHDLPPMLKVEKGSPVASGVAVIVETGAENDSKTVDNGTAKKSPEPESKADIESSGMNGTDNPSDGGGGDATNEIQENFDDDTKRASKSEQERLELSDKSIDAKPTAESEEQLGLPHKYNDAKAAAESEEKPRLRRGPKRLSRGK